MHSYFCYGTLVRPPSTSKTSPRRRARRWLVAGLGLGLVVLVLARPVGDRLTSLYFAPLAGPATPPDDALPCEQLVFGTSGGENLEGWWFPSRVESEAPLGVVLFAHGNYGHLEKQWQGPARLASRGFHVLAFDYRGFGDSEGRVTRRHAREDLLAALAVARGRAAAEGLGVAVVGQSMGAALALEALTARTDIAALVVDCPFSSWSGIAALHLVARKPARAAVRWALRAMLVATGREPIDAAGAMRVPLLVIAGTLDDVTPAEMARAIADRAGARLLLLEGEPHAGRRSSAAEQRVADAQGEFLRAALAASPALAATPAGR